MSERSTIRPVTLGRLVEVAHLCTTTPRSTDDVSDRLNVSKRRARETILEALRIDLIEVDSENDDELYVTTSVGERFLDTVQAESWGEVSDILRTRSPHYREFLEMVEEIGPANLDRILDQLEVDLEHQPYDFNQTGIEVVGDWAERLGIVQRNAFTGTYYRVNDRELSANFPYTVLSVYDELEDTAGVNLRQRYLSIPELREHTCERLACRRETFDDGLRSLATDNVGKVELSGAPIDTGAKDARYGIKRIALSDGDRLVSTSQSTDRVMTGIEQFEKQYYYLAVHDRDLTFDTEEIHE